VSTCFIADLHLSAEQPETVERFLRFLTEEANQHRSIYILGDLFEIWLGDTLPPQNSKPILQALRTLTTQGTTVLVQHGNRDFLLGREFEQKSGCRLISDPYQIDLDGLHILLMHGDQLCIDDTRYQNYRKFIRNPLVQWVLTHLPTSIRIKIGEKLRSRSNYDKANKRSEIMDVTQSEVEKVMHDNQVQYLIHGHTHRPAIHHLTVDGGRVQRIVLGDWESDNNVVCYQDGAFIQKSF